MAGTVADPSTYPLAPPAQLSWREQMRALRYFHTGSIAIRDSSGPVAALRLGPRRLVPPLVMVTSPQGAHDVLGGTDAAVDKEMIVHVESRLGGVNSFNMAHEQWLPRRRALQPVFTKRHVATFAGHMASAAEAAAAAWLDAGEVDLDARARRLTLRVLGRSVLGTDLDDRADELAESLPRLLTYVTRRSTNPLRAPEWLPTPARQRFRAAKDVVDHVISDALRQCREDPDHDAELIRLLVSTSDPETGAALSDEAIRDELFAFIVAGHDTTATTLTYALWQLGRHPAIQSRVAAEVDEIGDGPLGVDDVARLPFTGQVLNEAMRLLPPASAVGRMAMRDLVVDGHRVIAGTNVMVGIYALHHDPTLWENPESFDPDRFSPERPAQRDRWQFLPFGAGPRTCIGSHFAMLEATLGLATLIRRTRVTSLRDQFPVALPFTTTAGGPIPARVTPR